MQVRACNGPYEICRNSKILPAASSSRSRCPCQVLIHPTIRVPTAKVNQPSLVSIWVNENIIRLSITPDDANVMQPINPLSNLECSNLPSLLGNGRDIVYHC
jgi:hypothetical protein